MFLTVQEGVVGAGNALLLRSLPGVDAAAGYFAFQGGYKFRADYRFSPHPAGTSLAYTAVNVAPADHQSRAFGRRLRCRTYPGR